MHTRFTSESKRSENFTLVHLLAWLVWSNHTEKKWDRHRHYIIDRTQTGQSICLRAKTKWLQFSLTIRWLYCKINEETAWEYFSKMWNKTIKFLVREDKLCQIKSNHIKNTL